MFQMPESPRGLFIPGRRGEIEVSSYARGLDHTKTEVGVIGIFMAVLPRIEL